MKAQRLNAHHAPPAAAEEALTGLASALGTVSERFYTPNDHVVDYGALTVSREMQQLLAQADRLPGVNPAELNTEEQRIAFWLNTWNTLLLHTLKQEGVPDSLRSVDDLFTAARYCVGGHEFSLDDIEHGILRANARRRLGLGRILGRNDPRLALCMPRVEPMVHFGFYTACTSAPRLQAFTAQRIRSQLAQAATEVLDRTVQTADQQVWLPRTFHWYQDDFGGEAGVIAFVLRHLPEDRRRSAIMQNRDRLALHYLDYNWTVNDRFTTYLTGV